MIPPSAAAVLAPRVFNMSGGTVRAGRSAAIDTVGNSMGMVVGNTGSVGIVNQSGGLMVTGPRLRLLLPWVADCWWDTPGTGSYNLCGGT